MGREGPRARVVAQLVQVPGAVYPVYLNSSHAVRITGMLRDNALDLLGRLNTVLGTSSGPSSIGAP